MRQSKSLTLQSIELKWIFRKIRETNFGYCLKTGKMREEEGGWGEKERGRRVDGRREEEGGLMEGGRSEEGGRKGLYGRRPGCCHEVDRQLHDSQKERERERELEKRERERGVEPDGILQLQHQQQQQQQPGFKQIYTI